MFLKEKYPSKRHDSYTKLYNNTCSFCIFIGRELCIILNCIIIRVHSAFSLVASCVLLKYTRTDDVNLWRDLI